MERCKVTTLELGDRPDFQRRSVNLTTRIAADQIAPAHGTKMVVKTVLDPLFWSLSRPRLAGIQRERATDALLSRPFGFGWYKWLRARQVPEEFHALAQGWAGIGVVFV
jgi:hypothetical protein